MKKLFYLPLSMFAFLLFGCATTASVGRFYSEWESMDSISAECKLAANEEPRVYYSSDIVSDIYFLQSNYYHIVGHSGWNGPANDNVEYETISKCKELGAKVALYTWSYTDTRHGTYSTPHTNYHSYTDAYGYVRSYTTTTYSTNSYSINRYDYNVYFFVPYEMWYINMPKIGIVTRDLDSSDRMNSHRNTGVYVSIVYEDSPAFYANITRGDIIIDIDGINILNRQSYYDATDDIKAGDVVKITYSRNGIENQATLIIF